MRAPFLADSLPARLDSNFYPRPTSYLLQRVPLYYYMITSPHAMSHRSAKPVYQAAPPDPIAANPTQIAFYLRRAAALLDQIYAKISGHTTTMPVPPPPPPTSFGFGQPLHPQPNAQQTSTRHSNAKMRLAKAKSTPTAAPATNSHPETAEKGSMAGGTPHGAQNQHTPAPKLDLRRSTLALHSTPAQCKAEEIMIMDLERLFDSRPPNTSPTPHPPLPLKLPTRRTSLR